MKVSELINELMKLPQDAEVVKPVPDIEGVSFAEAIENVEPPSDEPDWERPKEFKGKVVIY